MKVEDSIPKNERKVEFLRLKNGTFNIQLTLDILRKKEVRLKYCLFLNS